MIEGREGRSHLVDLNLNSKNYGDLLQRMLDFRSFRGG